MSDDQQPIIIKKVKKGGHGGHHGGSWKVAFADFMTAMMAFFLVMWLVGQSDQVKQSVSEYFRDPGKYQTGGRAGVLKGGTSILNPKSPDIGSVTSEEPKPKNYIPTDNDRKQLQVAAKNILKELKKQKAFNRLKKNVKLSLTSEGLRIILNESETPPPSLSRDRPNCFRSRR